MEIITGNQQRGQSVLQQVRQGTFPAEWRTLTVAGQYFVRQGLLFSAATLLFLVGGGFMIMAGVTGTQGATGVNGVIVLLVGIFFALLGILASNVTVWTFGQVAHASEQHIILMPDGVVQYGVATMRKRTDRVIFYDQVVSMFMTTHVMNARTGQERLALTVRLRDGSSFDWDIDDRFGPKNATGAMLAAAFAQYEMAAVARV